MVANAGTISETKLHGKRRRTSISSAPSVAEFTVHGPRVMDQKFGSSDSTFTGAISGWGGNLNDAGGPAGTGCIRRFFYTFRGAYNAGGNVVDFQY